MSKELSLIEKVKKQKDESFNTWFERWFENNDFENKLIQSAAQGFSGYRIEISESNPNNDYLKLRLRDKRTVELLKDKLPGFQVEHVEQSGENQFFGISRKWYKDDIVISW